MPELLDRALLRVAIMMWRLLTTMSFLLCFFGQPPAQTRDASTRERAQQIEPFILESSRRYGINPRLLRAVCFLESRYRSEAISPKGARGLMQLMPETARRYGVKDPHNPRQSIDAGARYLRDLLVRFGGRLDLALAAYNAGEGTVEAYLSGKTLILQNGKVVNARRKITGGLPPYAETQAYVRSGLLLLGNEPALSRIPSLPKKCDFILDAVLDRISVETTLDHRPNAFFIEIQ